MTKTCTSNNETPSGHTDTLKWLWDPLQITVLFLQWATDVWVFQPNNILADCQHTWGYPLRIMVLYQCKRGKVFGNVDGGNWNGGKWARANVADLSAYVVHCGEWLAVIYDQNWWLAKAVAVERSSSRCGSRIFPPSLAQHKILSKRRWKGCVLHTIWPYSGQTCGTIITRSCKQDEGDIQPVCWSYGLHWGETYTIYFFIKLNELWSHVKQSTHRSSYEL